MRLEVEKIVNHGLRIRELWLKLPDGGDLPRWDAGSHIGLTLPVAQGNLAYGLKRHYSLIGNLEDQKHYRIAVLNASNSTGGSRYIHEHINVGQMLEVDVPTNGFSLDADASDFVLIAGGIGITPFYSMVSTLKSQGRRFKLYVLTHDLAGIPALDELESLSGDQLQIHVTGHAGKPELSELIGIPANGKVLYACGPIGLMQEIEREAVSLGWNRNNIIFESFGARVRPEDRVLSVHLAQSGISVQVMPGTTILSKLIESGAFIPHGCGKGECGFCYTEVISGELVHRDICLNSSQRDMGMCVCVSWASSETLVLNV